MSEKKQIHFVIPSNNGPWRKLNITASEIQQSHDII